jgi:hypothetical protein
MHAHASVLCRQARSAWLSTTSSVAFLISSWPDVDRNLASLCDDQRILLIQQPSMKQSYRTAQPMARCSQAGSAPSTSGAAPEDLRQLVESQGIGCAGSPVAEAAVGGHLLNLSGLGHHSQGLLSISGDDSDESGAWAPAARAPCVTNMQNVRWDLKPDLGEVCIALTEPAGDLLGLRCSSLLRGADGPARQPRLHIVKVLTTICVVKSAVLSAQRAPMLFPI